jgi:hypothetical protein
MTSVISSTFGQLFCWPLLFGSEQESPERDRSASLPSCRIPSKSGSPKLRDEIAQLSEANRLYVRSGKKKIAGAAGDHIRRLQRLQEILDELVALTDWKKL